MENVPFLYSDTSEKYCQTPFNQGSNSTFMAKLEVPRLPEKEVDALVFFKPPFVVSYESMAVDAGLGKNQRVNTEMVNKWCLMPKVIHIL